MTLLLTQVEAARLLGVGANKVRAWTRAGLLPVFPDPDSGRVVYPRPALERWAAEHQARPGEPGGWVTGAGVDGVVDWERVGGEAVTVETHVSVVVGVDDLAAPKPTTTVPWPTGEIQIYIGRLGVRAYLTAAEVRQVAVAWSALADQLDGPVASTVAAPAPAAGPSLCPDCGRVSQQDGISDRVGVLAVAVGAGAGERQTLVRPGEALPPQAGPWPRPHVDDVRRRGAAAHRGELHADAPLEAGAAVKAYTVLATFDGDQEVWWCDEPWDGARTDIGGGQVVGDVPLALWQEYSAALATVSRTRQALSDALGLHPADMKLAKACDEYEGTRRTIGTWRGWDDCEACGWPHEDHEDHR